jgi:hypothetical protein
VEKFSQLSLSLSIYIYPHQYKMYLIISSLFLLCLQIWRILNISQERKLSGSFRENCHQFWQYLYHYCLFITPTFITLPQNSLVTCHIPDFSLCDFIIFHLSWCFWGGGGCT